MENVDIKLPEIDNLYKFLALIMSDRISSQLQVNFNMKDVVCKEEMYKEFSSTLPKFVYSAIFKYKTRGILLFIDAKILYILSNRMLGGKGIIETKPKPMFTFSEDFFGKELISWFLDFYNKQDFKLKFLRVENDIEYIHYFYPDEAVYTAKMNCKFGQKSVGFISACHPKTILSET
jgi:flagellar motor switch protein FliM